MFKIHAKMIFIILTNCREKMMKEKRFAFRVSRIMAQSSVRRAQGKRGFEFRVFVGELAFSHQLSAFSGFAFYVLCFAYHRLSGFLSANCQLLLFNSLFFLALRSSLYALRSSLCALHPVLSTF